ncbi:MAG: hypothetical protein ACK5N8_06580 [Alphaproteobacteria bacterium]
MEEFKIQSLASNDPLSDTDKLNLSMDYLEKTDRSLDEYLKSISENNVEHNRKIYATFTSIKSDTSYDEKFGNTKFKLKDKDNELYLAIELSKPSTWSFEIHDGKVCFPENANPEQLKEMLSFLSARGIKSFNLPTNLLEQQKKIEDEKRPLDNEDLKRGNVQEFENRSSGSSTSDSKGIRRKDYVNSMRTWYEKSGKRKNQSAFHSSRIIGGWDVWTVFPNENRNNMNMLGKRDKDGNIKVNIEAQIFARIKRGKLQVEFYLPPQGKMTPMVAEQLVELHTMNGAKKIKFTGLCDTDLKEVRMACGKKMVVPTGIGLNIAQVQEMLQEARKKNNIGPEILDYERRLAEQIRENAENKGSSMSQTEAKFYNDTMEKVNIAAYKSKFEQGINSFLASVDKAGSSVSDVMASRYTAADVFTIYSNVVNSNKDKTVRGVLGQIEEVNARFGVQGKVKAQEQYNNFIKAAGLKGNEKMVDLGPEQIAALYDSLRHSRKVTAEKRMEKLYLDNTRHNSTDNTDRLVKTGLGEANKYFDTFFSKAYSGVVDKEYPIIPSSNEGLPFDLPDNVKELIEEKRVAKLENSVAKSGNEGRKNNYQTKVNQINSSKAPEANTSTQQGQKNKTKQTQVDMSQVYNSTRGGINS